MRTGVVVEFDEQVGTGRIEDGDGAAWAFHCTRITDGTRTVQPGAGVVFRVGPGGPGRWEAVEVLKLP